MALFGQHVVVETASAATAVLEWARINEYRSEGSLVETVRRGLPKRAPGPKYHGALHWSEVGMNCHQRGGNCWRDRNGNGFHCLQLHRTNRSARLGLPGAYR